MLNKYFSFILNLIKPYTFAEIGAFNLEFSNKVSNILEKYYDGNTIINYIIVTDTKNLPIYKNNFIDKEFIKYHFYSIGEYEELKRNHLIDDVEMSFIHNIEDYLIIKNYLEILKNTKCNMLDRYFKTDNKEFLKKSASLAVKDIFHFVFSEPEYIYEKGKILENYYVITGALAETLNLEERENENIGGNIGINFKNLLPNEKIHENIRKNIEYCRFNGIEELQPCEIHESVAYIIADAPSYKKKHIFEEILKHKNHDNHYLFVSKTAHEYMIENGVIPFGCIYLDPEEHVVKAHEDVIYFIASQCDPEVIKNLYSKKTKIYLYHAFVNTGEEKIFEVYGVNSPPIIGGSTSMTRGIMMLNMIGFYKFKLFGLDSSYEFKPKKVHGYNQKKIPFQINLEANNFTIEKNTGDIFWTDPEMLVQCNDLKIYINNFLNMQFENYSEGLFKKIYDSIYPNRNRFNGKSTRKII